MDDAAFTDILSQKGRELYRDMPWRQDTRPYYVLVSELMLQQTQVSRVIPKFLAFIEQFPDEKTLSRAPLQDVLAAWQGLGYNRRAKYLHDSATAIMHTHRGTLPMTHDELCALPGIGKNTAGAIMVYAFNKPAIFIETNVRTVYLHHYFHGQSNIQDVEIRSVLERTLDYDQPHAFYQALMDYGSWLKSHGVRNNDKSRHYLKQPPLKGSLREMRGLVLRHYTDTSSTIWPANLQQDERFLPALQGLIRDGLVDPLRSVDQRHPKRG